MAAAQRSRARRTRMTASILETERLRLRPYVPADESALFDVFSDPDARTFYPGMADRANVRAWIAWNLRNYDAFGFGLWAVELADSGPLIGDCGLTYQNADGATHLEIGYHIVARERRKGYASEAALACLDLGFTQTSCEQLCSLVNPLNHASCAVAGRLHSDSRPTLFNGKAAIFFFTSRDAWIHRRISTPTPRAGSTHHSGLKGI
jgi:ribosomal-protein-alanine N-acetyltransferase